MIPVRLQLTGFLSYHEPVELDFTSFDLACISGSNGAGKSSLLDAITWALFGQARRRDDALINTNREVKAAQVVYDFQYEGNLYRIQRAKPRDKPTVLEFFVKDGDSVWRPLTEKSVRETEARIQAILRMDYDTFTNASFFLQGRADQFAQQRPGDRKKVLSQILGLEVWEAYRAEAAERRKLEESEQKSLDAQLADIDSELTQEDARKKRLAEAEQRLVQLNKLCQAHEAVLVNLQRLAASLDEQRRLVDVLARSANEARLRYQRLDNQLVSLREECAGHQQVLAREGDVTAAYQRLQTLRADLARWDEVAANFREVEARRSGPLTTIASQESALMQERKTLNEHEFAILKELGRLPDLQAQCTLAAEAITGLEKRLAGRAAVESALQTAQQQVADARAENTSLKEAMSALKERIDRLSKVEGALCPLCGQPLAPAERAALMTSLQTEGKEMGDRYRANIERQASNEASARELQNQFAAFGRVEEELRSAHRQHDRLEADCARVQQSGADWQAGGALRLADVSRRLSELDFAHDARAALAEIDAASKALGYDGAAHDAIRRSEREARTAEPAMRALETARAALAPLERQIGGLETQLSAETAALATQEEAYRAARAKYDSEAAQLPDINQAEQEVFSMQAESNRLRMEVGMIRQLVAILNQQRERRLRLSAQREVLSLKIARLKKLEVAFSKDGVPALLIEQALPEIEEQANKVLDRLSAGGMSVRFDTQKLFKAKNRDDKKETLDIVISDSAGPREYELFSGGEAFRINFAIRLALSRVLAQRAGARLQTLVIDEGFGSQDADGVQRLIEAINQVRSEFAKIIVITHMESLKDAFPARIEVEKTPTGSSLRVVVN